MSPSFVPICCARSISQSATSSGPESELTGIAGNAESIWVGSDRGLNRLYEGEWDLVGEDSLPESDVRSVLMDDLERVWVATPMAVTRFVGDTVDTVFPVDADAVGVLDRISLVDHGTWLFGDAGAAFVGLDDAIVLTAPNLTGVDAAGDDSNGYLLNDQSLRRIDSAGYLYPSARAPLPDGRLTSIVKADSQPAAYWVATEQGTYELDGLFATYNADDTGVCARFATRLPNQDGLGLARIQAFFDNLKTVNSGDSILSCYRVMTRPLTRPPESILLRRWVARFGLEQPKVSAV